MNDAVDRVLIERGALDDGWPRSLLLSSLGHFVLVGGAFGFSLLGPREPPIKVLDVAIFEMPRGGGGVPVTEPQAPAPQATTPPETAPAQPEPPKILKPPKDEPKKGLAELDSKKKKPKADKSPSPAPASGGASGNTGKAPQPAGVTIGPSGPGIPTGTDSATDFYMASVIQKIWMIWVQQIKADFNQPIHVVFTIVADGSLEDVAVTEGSGVTLLDLAAKRAVYSAGPFNPLPKSYGTNRYTVQIIFTPK